MMRIFQGIKIELESLKKTITEIQLEMQNMVCKRRVTNRIKGIKDTILGLEDKVLEMDKLAISFPILLLWFKIYYFL